MIVGVIGSGSIGPDLAYGFLSALARDPAAKVYLVDIQQEALDAGVKRIEGYVEKGVARGKLNPKVAQALRGALVPSLDIKDLADCDYVLEAASEDLRVKQAILTDLERVVASDCLIGFATSGIPRAQIAARTQHPERCFVNHPFFPAWRSLPIEVVLSEDEALSQRMLRTLRKLGKVPVVTADVPCFAADDIFCNYIAEAARIVEEGLATAAQVDKIVNTAIGGGGPLNVMDGTRGNKLVVHCQILMEEGPAGSPWFTPPAILGERGDAAWHDRKNPGDPSHDEALAKKVLDRILAVLFARTYFVVEESVCSAADTNWLTRMALGFTQGLLDLAEETGAEQVRDLCRAYAREHPGFHIPRCIEAAKLPRFHRNIRIERDTDGIAVLRVHRPEVMNALSALTIAEIEDALRTLEADSGVSGVIFSSYDGALAGADITELAKIKHAADARDVCMRVHPLHAFMAGMSKPLVAAVNGAVLGGGAEFSMACHARVVGPQLLLGQPEVNLGIIPGYGGTQRLPRLIGWERAIPMLRTARPVGAKEACAWGWASGEPTADFIGAAKALIRDHLSGKAPIQRIDPAPLALPDELPPIDIGHLSYAIDTILVEVIRHGLALPLERGLELEAEGFGRCIETVDTHIGMTNFIQNGPRTPAAFLHE
jgi:enoyl-CoA hydratase/3-hydroxyacyl-CoA dehydrogenase